MEVTNNADTALPEFKSSSIIQIPFLTMVEFTEMTERAEQIMAWRDLYQDRIYRVIRLEEVSVQEGSRLSRYAKLVDRNGVEINVWLPSIVEKELTQIKTEVLATGSVFIQACGMKTSKTGRTYYDFKIVNAKF